MVSMNDSELTRTDVRLNAQQQQAVLMLAARLQQEQDESLTLADLIRIGSEAGLSREVIEEAFNQVASQENDGPVGKQIERSIGNELAAVHVTLVWFVATWLGILGLPANETVGFIGVAGTFFVYPTLVGVLMKRPWFAAALAMGVAMNLMLAFTVRFGLPTEIGARRDMVVFLVPVVLALVVSFVVHKLPAQLRNRGNQAVREP